MLVALAKAAGFVRRTVTFSLSFFLSPLSLFLSLTLSLSLPPSLSSPPGHEGCLTPLGQ